MATQPGLLQRGLNNLRNNARTRESGTERADGKSEGKGAGKLGKAGKKSLSKAKGGLKNLRAHLGFSGVDAYEDDYEEQRRRKRVRQLINPDEEEVVFTPRSGENQNIQETIAPEFRGQMAAGLAAGNSLTSGSTIVSNRTAHDDNEHGDSW